MAHGLLPHLCQLPCICLTRLALPAHPQPQEEGERAQSTAAELQASVDALQAREAASEGQLQQALAAASEENRQLKEQLAVRIGQAGPAAPGCTAAASVPQWWCSWRLAVATARPDCPPPHHACRPQPSRPSRWASSWPRSRLSGSAWTPRWPSTSRCTDAEEEVASGAGLVQPEGAALGSMARRARVACMSDWQPRSSTHQRYRCFSALCACCAAILPQELEEAEERLRSRAGELDAARASAEAAGERAAEAEARGRDLYEENKRLSEHISVGGCGCWLARGWTGGEWLLSCVLPTMLCTLEWAVWPGHPQLPAAPRVIWRCTCRCIDCFPAPAVSPPPAPQDLETRKRAPLYQKKQEEELKAAQDKAAEAEVRAGEAELKYKEARVSRMGWGVGGWVGGAAGLLALQQQHQQWRG